MIPPLILPSMTTLALVCSFAAAAYAGDPAIDAREVLRTNGYDGIWSMDCSRTPTDGIPRINWLVPDHGPVQQWVDIGHGYYLEGIVKGASVTPDGRFALSVNSLSGLAWVRTTIRIDERRIRIWELTDTWQNRPSLRFKNGRDPQNVETPPIEKCDDPPALTS